MPLGTPRTGDAYGAFLQAELAGVAPGEIVERDDGLVALGRYDYLAPVRRWHAVERRALRLARGRVLDVGCAAGRVGVELGRRGREVIGIDVSPGAVAVARARGVVAHECALEELDDRFGTFETVVMFGNNFGLFGSPAGVRRHLPRLTRITRPGARILATSLDPSRTEDPLHLAYHQRNRARGRPIGQVRLRVRHGDLATPWFDYLFARPAEMATFVEPAGWQLTRTFEDDGPVYVGVLERQQEGGKTAGRAEVRA